MKTLYLHVGHYKTGTSAVQKRFHQEGAKLKAHGLLYPKAGRALGGETSHGRLSLSLGARHGFVPPPWYRGDLNVEAAFAELAAEVEAAPQPRALISSEEFYQLALRKDVEAAFAELAGLLARFEVRPLIYLREPLALLKSWYNEVNKGGAGTRNFAMFYSNLDRGFLAQNRAVDLLSRTFGADKVVVRGYRGPGPAHLEGFLDAIGCAGALRDTAERVNEGTRQELLELVRLAKRRMGYDEATLTRLGGSLDGLIEKTDAINAGFADAASRIPRAAGGPIRSRLSLVAVFEHMHDLMRPLAPLGCLNDHEADLLRDLALSVEGADRRLARALMRLAHMIRPQGGFIAGKLRALEAAFSSERA
ncbi:MAG: hypothetical protein AAF763_04340 [Pseudomonadota bacterium]